MQPFVVLKYQQICIMIPDKVRCSIESVATILFGQESLHVHLNMYYFEIFIK